MTENSFAGVRIAQPTDTNNIYNLLLRLFDENAICSLSPQKSLEKIRACTDHHGGICGVIDGPNGIEATIGLSLGQWWYSDDWHLEESWNFVHPDYRKTTHAKRMIEFAKWAAHNMNVPLIIGIVTRKRLEPKMRLYQRQLEQVGALFMDKSPLPDSFNQRKLS